MTTDSPQGREPQFATVDGADVRKGDDLIFLGAAHRIAKIVPYQQSARAARAFEKAGLLNGAADWRIAVGRVPSERLDWRITLIPGQSYEVVR